MSSWQACAAVFPKQELMQPAAPAVPHAPRPAGDVLSAAFMRAGACRSAAVVQVVRRVHRAPERASTCASHLAGTVYTADRMGARSSSSARGACPPDKNAGTNKVPVRTDASDLDSYDIVHVC